MSIRESKDSQQNCQKKNDKWQTTIYNTVHIKQKIE